MSTPQSFIDRVKVIMDAWVIPDDFTSSDHAEAVKAALQQARRHLGKLLQELEAEMHSTRTEYKGKIATAGSLETLFLPRFFRNSARKAARQEVYKEGVKELAPYKRVEMAIFEALGTCQKVEQRIDQYLAGK